MQLTHRDKQIHAQAQQFAHAHRSAEQQLVEILLQVERARVHHKLGCTSLFMYVVDHLKLGESTAYSLCAVARKCREVPQLKTALAAGQITLHKAGRIVPVLTPANADEILEFAATNSTRETDKFVAKLNPRTAVADRARAIDEHTYALQMTVSDACLRKLKRVQSLRASEKQTPSFEASLEAALDVYLAKHDPMIRAQRANVRAKRPKFRARGNSEIVSKVSQTASNISKMNTARPARVPLTAAEKHAVFLRDIGQCTHVDVHGQRCSADRWLHIHHITPVGEGGDNSLSNLKLLCSLHHDLAHQLSFAFEAIAQQSERVG